jgi:phosphatidylserine/phosphatidylglycerophosphate/cardiolipin synthase-like enzyme
MSWLVALSLLQANVYFASDTLILKLRARIDAAQSSIDLCLYNCDSSLIVNALISAHQTRQVAVRVITDDARLSRSWLARLRSAGIPVWTDSGQPGANDLMHNKFAVFDYKDADPANDWVWTGSFNVIAGSYCADNAIEVQDSGLAHAFTQEFEQMWGGSDTLPNRTQARFHNGKTDRLSRHRFAVGADTFRLYFSPQNRPVDTLARLAGQAQSEIGFAIYAFTYLNLARAMRDRHNQGIWVGGTFDLSESTNVSSCFDSMRHWGIPVFTDKFLGASNLLHEKVMVIDRHVTAAGSVNWSNAGNSANDENSLIVNSDAIAARYRSEIATRYTEAGGVYPGIAERSIRYLNPRLEVELCPNPTRGRFQVCFTLPDRCGVSLELYNSAGRCVRSSRLGLLKSGRHSATLDMGRLPPGVHLVHLSAGSLTSTRQLVVR